MKRKTQICTINIPAGDTPWHVQPAGCPTRQRLAEAFCLFEKIQLDRADRRDPLFCSLLEQRIIWRELVELELQEADEQIARISKAAGDNSPY